MNALLRTFGLTIALGGASTSIASACCTAPDPCPVGISCTINSLRTVVVAPNASGTVGSVDGIGKAPTNRTGPVRASDATTTSAKSDEITGPPPSITAMLQKALASLIGPIGWPTR